MEVKIIASKPYRVRHSELRKGNITSLDKEIIVITRVGLLEEMSGVWETYGFMSEKYPIEGIASSYTPSQSVPLTEEWIKRAGFSEVEEHKGGYNWYLGRIRLLYLKGEAFFVLQDRFDKNIRYHIESVHELQNIYKLITGEDLKIELPWMKK